MSIFDRFTPAGAVERLTEEALYAQVARELEEGVRRDGLWAKALANSDGDQERAKGLYIKYRVRSITDEAIVAEQAMRSAEQTARTAEEADRGSRKQQAAKEAAEKAARLAEEEPEDPYGAVTVIVLLFGLIATCIVVFSYL